jgi:hypothetical protein
MRQEVQRGIRPPPTQSESTILIRNIRHSRIAATEAKPWPRSMPTRSPAPCAAATRTSARCAAPRPAAHRYPTGLPPTPRYLLAVRRRPGAPPTLPPAWATDPQQALACRDLEWAEYPEFHRRHTPLRAPRHPSLVHTTSASRAQIHRPLPRAGCSPSLEVRRTQRTGRPPELWPACRRAVDRRRYSEPRSAVRAQGDRPIRRSAREPPARSGPYNTSSRRQPVHQRSGSNDQWTRQWPAWRIAPDGNRALLVPLLV